MTDRARRPIGSTTRVAGLEVVGELGRGGMGVVLRARDPAAGRDVAVKLLLDSRGPEQLERFEREGRLLAGLDHPGIVRVHGAGQDAGRPYLVVELVEGARGLDEASRGLPLLERARLVRDAARALGHAHARGVVHRDVKPANLLVDAAGRVRVTDFGLATASGLERLTQTGMFVGTPSHMAPEQIVGGAPITPATDVWSLGVVLYEALTGVLPFDPEGGMVPLLARISQASPTPPRQLAPAVPPALEAVALHALQADPAARWADGEAMAQALDAALAGRAVAAGGRRARPLLAAPVAAMVGLAAVAALYRPERRDPPRPAPREPARPRPGPVAPTERARPETDPVRRLEPPLVAGTPAADDASRRLLEVAAREAGSPDAMVELGRVLRREGAVEAASGWFRQAAATGHREALQELGEQHEGLAGGRRDLALAVAWYRGAADLGDPEGLAGLLRVARRSPPAERDAAIERLRAAFVAGGHHPEVDAAALAHLLAARARPADQDDLREWLLPTAAGSSSAALLLAALAATGRDARLDEARRALEGALAAGRVAWPERAEELLLHLAGRDEPAPAFARAQALHDRDPQAGRRQLQELAARGSTAAMVYLSLALESAEPATAAAWLQTAADAGDPRALLALAARIATGRLAPAPGEEAAPMARAGLAWLGRRARPDDEATCGAALVAAGDPAGVALLERAFRAGNVEAALSLAEEHATGVYVERDRARAERYARHAVLNGAPEQRARAEAFIRALR